MNLAHPFVLIGVGPTGHRVARDIVDTARALDAGAPVANLAWTGGPRARPRLLEAATEALATLLRAGSVHGAGNGGARLDVLVIADASEVPTTHPADAMATVATHLGEAYGVLFPATAPPTERGAWGTVLLALPAVGGPTADAGMAALNALEVLRAAPPHPLLSRVLVLPRQTTAGRLDDESVERSLRAAALALYLSGAREHQAIRGILGHRADDRVVVELSVAAAELPVARLRRYARWRLVWEGLSELVARGERPTGDPSRAEALVSRLAVEELLEPFREGDAAQRVRRHAAALSGAVDRLPENLDVRLVERDADLQHRYRTLLGPAVKPPPDRATEHPEHAEVLRLMDREESVAVKELASRLDRLLAAELEPGTALEVLPHLEAALDRAAHALAEASAAVPPPLPERDPPAPPSDPGRAALSRALEGRPRPVGVLPLAFAVALVFGTAAAFATAAILVEPTPASAFSSATPQAAPLWAPLLVGVGAGLVAAAGWTLAVLHAARITLQAALRTRHAELDALWRRGGGGQPGLQAKALLAVRRRRTTASLGAELRRATDRLGAARASLRSARDHARRGLERLRVHPASAARADDLSDLLGPETPLHRPLLPPEMVAERLAAARTIHEPARLARALLEVAWPTGGLVRDLPAADPEQLAEAADGLIPGLGPDAMLRGENVTALVEHRLHAFVRDLGNGLASGLDPRDANGDPIHAAAPWLVVAPAGLRALLEGDLGDRSVPPTLVSGDADVPWVVTLATWAPLDVASIARGIR